MERDRCFIFVKDMPFGDGKIMENTRLNVHKGTVILDGMMLTPNYQKSFLSLIEREIKEPNYLREVLI